jgi:predicted dehydrogenase
VKEIGVAMIGTGFMSWVHTEALKRVGVTVTGILGSTPEKSRIAAGKLELPRAYSTFEDVLNDTTVDAVHIGTPNRLHLPMTKAAIAAGKHVMCEKPLAMDAMESAELLHLANENPQLATAVCYNVRYYPHCHQAREMIRQGELGRLFHVTGSVTQDWLALATDYNWRVLSEEGGTLRALSDIGSHWLDLIHFITGLEIEAVCADFVTVHPTRLRPKGEVETFTNKLRTEQEVEPVAITTDDYGALLLRFKGGARACMFVSQVSPGRKYCIRFEVAGQEKTLFWDSQESENLWVGRRDGPNLAFKRDASLMHDTTHGITDYPGGHNEGYPDTFKMLFRDFYRYIAAGDFTVPRPYPTFADGHRDIVLMDAVIQSQKTGCWVKIESEEEKQ